MERTRFVGRALEVAELEEQLRVATTRGFQSVLLTGDPGIGKTRLCGELVARNRQRIIPLSARAHRLGSTASFGLWAEAFERHLRHLSTDEVVNLCGGFIDDLAALLRSVAAVRGSAPEGEPPRVRILEGLAVTLANLASNAPVVVILDDVHFADASSWEALDYLSRNLLDAPILVIAAARPVELAEHKVATNVLLGLDQDGLLHRMWLDPFVREGVQDLASAALKETPPSALVEWLLNRSRGNPLFALGLLQALLDEGADLSNPNLRTIPEALAERVGSRLEALDEPSRSTLEVLAVLGYRVDLDDLVNLTGSALDDLAAVLQRLVRVGLVLEEERGPDLNYEIAHPLIQEAIYQRIGGARRRALHRHIGRALLDAGHLGQAAPHFARSAKVGDPEAVQVLRDAVRQAEELGAYQEALAILGALVDLLPHGDQRWLDVLDALSRQADWVVDHRSDLHALTGLKAMQEIDFVLEGSDDPIQQATVKFRLAQFLAWGPGELEEAERVCKHAHELFDRAGDQSRKLQAANELVWIRALNGDMLGKEEAARQVLEAAEAAGESFVAMEAAGTMAFGAFWVGRFEEAEKGWRRCLEIAQAEGRLYRVSYALSMLGLVLAFRGRISEALPLVEQAKWKNPAWRETILPEWETMIHWLGGNFPAAVAGANDSVVRNPAGLSKRRAWAISYSVLAATESERIDEAQAFMARIRAAYGDRDWGHCSDCGIHAEGVLAWRTGDGPRALGLLSRAAYRMVEIGTRPFAAFALLDLAEVAARSGEPLVAADSASRLRTLAQEIDRDLYHALAGLASSWADVSSANFKRAAEQAQLAADVLSETDCRAFLGRALYVLGRSLLVDDPNAAPRPLRQAAEAFEACQARWRRSEAVEILKRSGVAVERPVSTTVLPDRTPLPAGQTRAGDLTPREKEVLALVARGLSNQQIARELVLSVRTVERHLSNIYEKLGGVGRVARAHAAAYAVSRGLTRG